MKIRKNGKLEIQEVNDSLTQSAIVNKDVLTDTQLRASAVAVNDDFSIGELLDDQSGNNTVKTFTFSQPVVGFWIASIGATGLSKLDHYGGTPSPTRGIPLDSGGILVIPEPVTEIKVYIPTGITITVWGQLR